MGEAEQCLAMSRNNDQVRKGKIPVQPGFDTTGARAGAKIHPPGSRLYALSVLNLNSIVNLLSRIFYTRKNCVSVDRVVSS